MHPIHRDASRVASATALPDDLNAVLHRLRKGAEPLRLFTTVGRYPRLLRKLFAGSLLDAGNLTLRQREIVIHRVTARCGADYEVGVHGAHFAPAAGLGPDSLAPLADPQAVDVHWASDELALIVLCDSLHSTCQVGDSLWSRLKDHFSNEALPDLLMLAGYYRMINYLCNGLALPNEDGTDPIPSPARTTAQYGKTQGPLQARRSSTRASPGASRDLVAQVPRGAHGAVGSLRAVAQHLGLFVRLRPAPRKAAHLPRSLAREAQVTTCRVA